MTNQGQLHDASPDRRISSTDQALHAAVAEAVQSGLGELSRLDRIVTQAESRLRSVGRELPSGGRRRLRRDGFFALLGDVVDDLKDNLSESRRAASTFNIVFFGRTGAGKSTLLSALGGLNGELVSDGHGDFTTDVQPLDWRGCRLYDTPGIAGWGRTRPKAELEEAARAAVEVADVVLLCFDTQSQQAAEFGKVAEWVRTYRKPVIAALNIRNAMWRHPARVASPAVRAGLSRTAQQHADNIISELDAIGLPDVPVVAIQSKRALFARALIPFGGPAASELESERATYGVEYLDRWSNLPVLEQLVSSCIVEGAADLRLSALREGLQSRLRVWADQIARVEVDLEGRGLALEGVVDEWLSVLGYPEVDWRRESLPRREDTDVLTLLEDARGEPFRAPVSGRLESHVRHLLRSHLYPQRMESLRKAENLIVEAFDSDEVVPEAEFDLRVYDSTAIAVSIATVAGQAGDFLSASVNLATLDARIDLHEIDRSAQAVRGDAGLGGRRAADFLRGAGLLGTGAGAVLAIIAAANIWNPGGWLAFAILGGLALYSGLTGFFGKKTRKRAEAERAGERAHAIANARSAVNAYFNECEARQLQKLLGDARHLAAGPLGGLIEDSLHTRWGRAKLRDEEAWLRVQAANQPPTTLPSEVIRRATDRLHMLSSDSASLSARQLLLGEDWIVDSDLGRELTALAEGDLDRFRETARVARSGFSNHLAQATRDSRVEAVRQWLGDLASSPHLDEGVMREVTIAQSLIRNPPVLVVIGDYSSGKTSLVKRLLAEADSATADGLGVAAQPATSEARRYDFGPWDLVDAPGFQSGRVDHDSVAVAAARDAALVVVVLHVNLLIGDTSRLQQLLLGDETTVGKAASTVFVIGRMDEVGADPRLAPRDFLVRRRRKVEELLAILRSKGLVVAPEQVLAVAADPYGLVGDRSPVTREIYATEYRVWDGVSTLSRPLLQTEAQPAAERAALAALDRGRSALLAAQQRLRHDIADLDSAQIAVDRASRFLEASLAELHLLEQSIESRTRRTVNDHASELITEALGAGPDQADALAKKLESWWEDPRLGSAMDTLWVEIDRELDEWSKRHASELEREIRRLEFAVKAATQRGRDAKDMLAGGVRVAAQGAKHLGDIAKAVGNRDAVYAIVKAAGGKFKPWGAVKLGAKVAKVGAVLGVVAVGLDIADWVMSQRREDAREKARKQAVDYVRDTAGDVVADLLNRDGGPMSYIEQVGKDLTDQSAQLRQEREVRARAMTDAERQLNGIIDLHAIGEQLATTTTERTAR